LTNILKISIFEYPNKKRPTLQGRHSARITTRLLRLRLEKADNAHKRRARLHIHNLFKTYQIMRKSFSMPVLFRVFTTAIFCLLAASMASAQPRPWMPPAELVFSAKGTGRTTGHIADLDVRNPGPRPRQVEIPASVIPSDGKHQGFATPQPTPVTVPGNSTVTVPIQGYCTDPDLPAPPPGTPLSPVNTWDTGSPLIPILHNITQATTDLQQRGQLSTPFSNNPPREREAVIQQFTWYYSMPSTYDPCVRISQNLASLTRDTDWFTSHRPDIEQGIAQIADAMTRVGRAARIPDFRPPAPPVAAALPTPAPPPSHPIVANTVRVTGTGRTTGHIADITVSNPTKEPIIARIGNGGGMLIPSNGRDQSYIVPSIPDIPVAPGQTATVPVEGFCVDVHRPPVGAGSSMPPIQSWVGGGMPDVPAPAIAPTVPEPMNPPSGTQHTVVNIPTQTALPLSQITNILENTPRPPAMTNWDCPDLPVSGTPLVPGTDTPIRVPVSPDAAPALAVPILLDAITRIIETTDRLLSEGDIRTPFSSNRDKEREAVIQQTFWYYSSALQGEPYTKEDFHDNTVRQFESNTNRPYDKLPPEQQTRIDQGVDDFWDSFQAVGVEAKILPKVPEPPKTPALQDLWDDSLQKN
jgi:hypothetical protein